MELKKINFEMSEEERIILQKKKRDSAIRFALFISFFILALAFLNHAQGEFNYDVYIYDENKIVAIGEDAFLNAYVSYNGSAVKKKPCILSIFDYKDNHTLYSSREYTDELGYIHTKIKITDTFLYTNNYTYTLQCSNTTVAGSIYVKIGETPNWFLNPFVYVNENSQWLMIFLMVVLCFIFLASVIRKVVSYD